MTANLAPPRPHTRASLAAQLRDLGVRPGGAVLVLGPVGDGTGRLMRQRAAVDFAVEWLARPARTEES